MFTATSKKIPDDIIKKSAIQLPIYNGFLAIVRILLVYREFTLIYRQEQLSQWP
jgi:hypothetical protein